VRRVAQNWLNFAEIAHGTGIAQGRGMMSLPSSIRVVFEDMAYGARLGVLECDGARVAVVLRRGALAAVAPMPGASLESPGLSAILELLTAASRVRAEVLSASRYDRSDVAQATSLGWRRAADGVGDRRARASVRDRRSRHRRRRGRRRIDGARRRPSRAEAEAPVAR
jgi:hypothetical protein